MSTPEPILRRGADRHAVDVVHSLPHRRDQVWHAVTTADSLAQWFPGAPEFALHVGGTVHFPEFAGDPAEFGEVLECDPPQRLRFSWSTDQMALDLQEESGGTRLTLTHEFDDLPGAASFATGWEACLEGLHAVLDDRPVPDPGPRRARHEELAARFGLDEPEVDETAEGWSLHVERQLVCPPDGVWDLLVGDRDVPPEESISVVAGEALLTPRAPQAPREVLGYLTEVDIPALLAVDIVESEPGDHLRLALGPGTGHGARLTLTVRGRDPREKDHAITRWRDGLVRALARSALTEGEDGIDRRPAEG